MHFCLDRQPLYSSLKVDNVNVIATNAHRLVTSSLKQEGRERPPFFSSYAEAVDCVIACQNEDVSILVVANLLSSDWIRQVRQLNNHELFIAYVSEPSTLCTINLKQVVMHLNCLEIEFIGLYVTSELIFSLTTPQFKYLLLAQSEKDLLEHLQTCLNSAHAQGIHPLVNTLYLQGLS